MKRFVSISMAMIIFSLSVLHALPVYAISDDPTIAAHQGDCPDGYVPLNEATVTDTGGITSWLSLSLSKLFSFSFADHSISDFYRDVTEGYVSSVVATDETHFNSIVIDMLAAGCANYIYINQITGKTLAGAYFWELLDGICDSYFSSSSDTDGKVIIDGKTWVYMSEGLDTTYYSGGGSVQVVNNSSSGIYWTIVDGSMLVCSFITNDGTLSVTPGTSSTSSELITGNGYLFGYKSYWYGMDYLWAYVGYANQYSLVQDGVQSFYNSGYVPSVSPNGDGYTRDPDTSLTFDPSTWFSFDWPDISNDTYIEYGDTYSETIVNYNDYINNYYNYVSDDNTNLLLRILNELREWFPILASISDTVEDGFNDVLAALSDISLLADIKSLLQDIKTTVLAILAAVIFDSDVTEVVNDEEDGNAITYTIGLIILVFMIFVYVLKITVHLLSFIVAFFNIEAAVDSDFLPEGMLEGFQYLDQIIIPYFNVSVWDFLQTLLFIVIMFSIIHQIYIHVKNFKFGE